MNTRPNQAPPPNRRPHFPLGSLGDVEHLVCALPASPAAVGEARRYAAPAMSTSRISVVLAIFFVLSTGFCSPSEDLASPSPEVRDAAARILRASWVAPARTNWEALLARIKVGDSKTNVLELLSAVKATPEGREGGGNVMSELYRLDDLWVLQFSYYETTDNRLIGKEALIGKKLVERMRAMSISAPTNFSGVWTTYWANGQPQSKIHCTNGLNFGEFTGFYSDGKKAYVQHYGPQGADGEDTGYFRSGRVAYKGLYRANAQVGAWIWYNEDGSTNLVREYSRP